VGIRINILFYIVVNIIALACVRLLVQENKNWYKQDSSSQSSWKEAARDPKKGIRLNGLWRAALMLGLAVFFFESSISPIDEFWTIMFTEKSGFSTWYLGWILASGNILVILFIHRVIRLLQGDGPSRRIFPLLCLLASLTVIGFTGISSPLIIVACFLLFRLLVGIYEPLFEIRLNAMIGSRHRATVLSVYNMMASGGEVISVVGLGILAETYSLTVAFYICSIGLLLTGLVFMMAENFLIRTTLIESEKGLHKKEEGGEKRKNTDTV